MKIIGVTGTSGSGKTTICNILNTKYNVYIIDCDKMTRQMLIKDTKYFNAVVEIFGREIIQLNGEIDRKKLAAIIYSSKKECEKLNKITNKFITSEVIKEIEMQKNKKNIIIIDAPLLIESNLKKLCNIVISVLANKELKLARICKRDKIEKDVAESRLKIQQKDEFYIENSDYIITNNDNNIEKLETDIENIFSNM